jgi:hypothetical protein
MTLFVAAAELRPTLTYGFVMHSTYPKDFDCDYN